MSLKVVVVFYEIRPFLVLCVSNIHKSIIGFNVFWCTDMPTYVITYITISKPVINYEQLQGCCQQ